MYTLRLEKQHNNYAYMYTVDLFARIVVAALQLHAYEEEGIWGVLSPTACCAGDRCVEKMHAFENTYVLQETLYTYRFDRFYVYSHLNRNQTLILMQIVLILLVLIRMISGSDHSKIGLRVSFKITTTSKISYS